jgi:hypothetical protein
MVRRRRLIVKSRKDKTSKSLFEKEKKEKDQKQ